jgi:hypothetical protein
LINKNKINKINKIENNKNNKMNNIKNNQEEIPSQHGSYIHNDIGILGKCADIFTPLRIKTLSNPGRKNMGIYGALALTFLFVLILMDAYALRNESIIVIINSLLAFVFSIFNLEKMIASILHFFKKFK